MPRPFVLLLLTTLFTVPLTGCGQKGPLHLPDDEPAAANDNADSLADATTNQD